MRMRSHDLETGDLLKCVFKLLRRIGKSLAGRIDADSCDGKDPHSATDTVVVRAQSPLLIANSTSSTRL